MRLVLPFLCLLQMALFAEEQVIKRAPLPNRILKQGEALLIQPESGSRFMRIALSTKHLAKVESKIIEGEKRNWPNSADSAAYLKVLRDICRQAIANGDKPVILTLNWHSDRVELIYQDKIYPVENLSAEYMEQNLSHILRDRFDLSPAQAKDLLQREEAP